MARAGRSIAPMTFRCQYPSNISISRISSSDTTLPAYDSQRILRISGCLHISASAVRGDLPSNYGNPHLCPSKEMEKGKNQTCFCVGFVVCCVERPRKRIETPHVVNRQWVHGRSAP